MHPLVMKFGGTSVGSPAAIRRAADLAAQEVGRWDGLVVVVSAMSGVTNALLKCARLAANEDEATSLARLEELRSRHAATLGGLGLDGDAELRADLERHWQMLREVLAAIRQTGAVTPQRLDEAASFGERINARILAAVLRELGLDARAVDATGLILTGETHPEGARPIQPQTDEGIRAGLLPLLEAGILPVVTGFIGSSLSGKITTLGRGASDYTSTLVGAALQAAEVWNWTDVNGVMSGDPRYLPDARLIPTLSYDEMRWLAAFGARVLHPETVLPIAMRDIPLRVRNTFHPLMPGSRVQGRGLDPAGGALAIACLPLAPARPGWGLMHWQLPRAGETGLLDWLEAGLLPAGWRALQAAPSCELVTVIGGETRPWEVSRVLSSLPFEPLAVARNLPGESFGVVLPRPSAGLGSQSILTGQMVRWLHAHLVLPRSNEEVFGRRVFYDLSTNSIATSNSAL